MSKKKHKNRSLPGTGSIITSAVFLSLVFGFSLAGIASPDRKFSEMENRSLQQAPEVSIERIKNGSFTGDIEKYTSDQIFMKDELVTMKTGADSVLGKRYMNGVYLADDDFYIQDFKENTELIKTNIDSLNAFADGLGDGIEVDFLLAPNASCVLNDKLPKANQCGDQSKTAQDIQAMLSQKIHLAYPEDALKTEAESCYYRTDHHWTAKGAELGYSALRQVMGLPVQQSFERTSRELGSFYGTLYSKAPRTGALSDTIELVTYEGNEIMVSYPVAAGDHDIPAECTETGGVPKKDGLFVKAPESTKDKYAAIMGGNFALTEIETNAPSDEKVLVLKDSYANAVLPELCAQFAHISMIDLRYYHMQEESVSEYVKSHGINRVIYIYNIDFLNSDNNFVWLE